MKKRIIFTFLAALLLAGCNTSSGENTNIEDLSEFIEQFPNLKLFNISDNYIDLDDPKNKKIINQIKNKYKNCKFYFTEENN